MQIIERFVSGRPIMWFLVLFPKNLFFLFAESLEFCAGIFDHGRGPADVEFVELLGILRYDPIGHISSHGIGCIFLWQMKGIGKIRVFFCKFVQFRFVEEVDGFPNTEEKMNFFSWKIFKSFPYLKIEWSKSGPRSDETLGIVSVLESEMSERYHTGKCCSNLCIAEKGTSFSLCDPFDDEWKFSALDIEIREGIGSIESRRKLKHDILSRKGNFSD